MAIEVVFPVFKYIKNPRIGSVTTLPRQATCQYSGFLSGSPTLPSGQEQVREHRGPERQQLCFMYRHHKDILHCVLDQLHLAHPAKKQGSLYLAAIPNVVREHWSGPGEAKVWIICSYLLFADPEIQLWKQQKSARAFREELKEEERLGLCFREVPRLGPWVVMFGNLGMLWL